ncbi:hypothetical protein KFK09_026237 [Dendrobium nobile]|uniref:Uncharacterized protein n=1 Tax=Dendrobium nobile TaxID=94219 RepID=A0A8T3A7N5_DENNO|nr:hypothetical protein KFK09_026237 [Dendrobium nobile]
MPPCPSTLFLDLEEETCFEFRMLAQNYPKTPDHTSSHFWNQDSGSLQGYMLSSPPSHFVSVVSKFKLTRDLWMEAILLNGSISNTDGSLILRLLSMRWQLLVVCTS